jgi:chromosome segregation ATPase
MSEAMSAQAAPAPVVNDFDYAYKLGRLCGEVRVLKWGAGAALAVILASMGVLYEAIDNIGIELIGLRKDISALRTDMTGVQKDVTAIDARVVIIEGKVVTIEERVATIEEDLADLKRDVSDLKTDVSDLKKMHSSSPAEARGLHGTSRDFPKHADSAREPVPPARTTPPA